MSTAADDDVELSVTDGRAQLAELLDTRVREGGVVYLTRYGRRVGAVVPSEVAEHLDDIVTTAPSISSTTTACWSS
jgi:prevent-host-death family protein